MSDRWLGIKVADKLFLVALDFSTDPPKVIGELAIAVPKGDRIEGYVHVHNRLRDFVIQNKITDVAVAASALSQGGTGLGHLKAAELRGVTLFTCKFAGATVHAMDMAAVSRNKAYGERTAKQYVDDPNYWEGRFAEELSNKDSKFAAYTIEAARKSLTL